MDLHISLVGRGDLSGEIYRQVRRAIVEHRLRPNDRLPPTRELARSLRVSRMTVTVAYERLAGAGFVTPRVGAGTFVADHVTTSQAEPSRRQVQPSLRARPIWDSISPPTALARSAPFDFRTGVADVSAFPFDAWRRHMDRQWRASSIETGTYAGPAGHPRLREAIAHHLGVARGIDVSSDDVLITNGTQQALDVVARTLLSPGDRVAVEDPGYQAPRRLLRSLGIDVRGTPVDREGIVVDALPAASRLVLVTPSHQYPLGVVLSLRRRHALLEWADRNDAAILEDDYDSEFRFAGRPVEPLKTLDTSDRVIYVGTFSKTMLPTLRLGFLVMPPTIAEAARTAKSVSDWHTSMPIQAALAAFIDEGGFARHIRKMRSVYQERHEMITDLIGRDFAGTLDLVPSMAGLHVAALASDAGAIDGIADAAIRAGVAIQELSWFTQDVEPAHGLLFGYGGIATSKIPEGVRLLQRSLGRLDRRGRTTDP